MKSVLISIKPKWCELIASGKKTIEVRKTRPKCAVPFKCYIYCTKEFYRKGDGYFQGKYCGKVIGEFVCDRIINIDCDSIAPFDKDLELYIDKQTCVNREQLFKYTKGRCCYGWHIFALVIYDKPKDLDDFMAFGKTHCDQKNCGDCLYMGIDGICDVKDIGQPMTRPPQSWCYVEESKE